MNSENVSKEPQAAKYTPDYLKHWPGLSMRKGDAIIDAGPEDTAVAKRYPIAKDKGNVTGGKRITLLTKKNRYRVNEEIRVVHVLEVLEPGHRLFVMGPKAIYGEYIDGIPVTQEQAAEQIYDGLMLESPNVDYNYDITSYTFSEPGRHEIYWQMGELRSNLLELEIVP